MSRRIDLGPELLWALSADRRTMRLQLPALTVAGAAKPVNVFMEFDAETADRMLRRLVELRAQMLPPPKRH